MFYAISPTGDVYSYKRIANATDKATEVNGFVGSDATESDTGLTNVPTPLLVILYNLIRPEKPVARFADRKTGETRMKGVLEVLSKPGDLPIITETDPSNPAPSAEETDMATKTKAKKTATKKASTAKTPRAPKAEISEAIVKRVIKKRADGVSWPEICTELGEGTSFIHRIRPLMKKMDRSSVAKLGPGSPNYGKAK
jgi:hypothetical protein